MSDLIFLPDREGREELNASAGFVRLGANASDLRTLADRMALPQRQSAHQEVTMWRGVLALALLCDAWPDDPARVVIREVDGTGSLFAAWVLSSRPVSERKEPIRLALLERGGKQVLLGVANADAGLTLPAAPSDFADMVPARALWYDGEADTWHDPVPYLNEHERAVLMARLQMMDLADAQVAHFINDLSNAGQEQIRLVREEDEAALRGLSTRIQAVCGLKDFEAFSVRREMVAVTEDNALVRLFAPVDVRYGADARESGTYLWQGVPFARTSAALGLAPTGHPDEETALETIHGELLLMTDNSTRWNRQMAAAIDQWLADQDLSLLSEVRRQAENVRQYQAERSREVQSAVTLNWPWNASSGAVRCLLREHLGDGWLAAAATPFADKLTKLTGHVLGDRALQTCCACADGVLLPPLSQEMAACAASAGDGEGLALDAFRYDPMEDGGVTASFLLRGRGEVRMVRAYGIGDICVLSEEEAPTVAVWPCVPMERWKAYHVFTRHGDVQLAALSGGQWVTLDADEASAAWRCLHTETYPACLTVLRHGQCLGALPNMLPLLTIEESGDAVAAIDMGSSATAVALTVDGKLVSAQGQELTRLLVTPQEMPEDDFLLSLTPTAVTPSAVALIGAGDTLFTDGYVYAVSRFDALRDMVPGTVHTALKWRADAVSVRARKILLHQVMLGVSLNAMLCGVKTLRWRVTVADEMGDEGRHALLDLVEDLSAQVALETGLPITPGKNAVIWAEEAAALHAFLRGEGGQKGSIAVLDVGGGSIKLHLWMQGRARPSAGAVLMTGSQTVLLDALKHAPEMLRADFADCGDDALISAVDVLCDQLALAKDDPAQTGKALLMLDALLDGFKAPVTRHLYARFQKEEPTFLQAILLETLCGAMFSVGLMLEQAGGDSLISHLFPEDLPVCFTGRGAWLLETLTPQLRNGLQRIVRSVMNLRHPVHSVTIRPAQLPALGVALGMTALRQTETPIDPPVIRTRHSFSELMRLLMTEAFRNFPMHMWRLHPGLIDQWGHIVPAGEDAIRYAASQVYEDGEDIPGAAMDFLARMRRTPILPDEP